MSYDLDKIRASREERRKRMLAAAQAEEGSNGKQHAEAVEEKPEPAAPVLERRRRTTRDAAVADTVVEVEEKPSRETLPEPEKGSVDVVSANGKEQAVYEAPKPEVLESTGSDDALLARVEAVVRKAVREEFSRLHIRFGTDDQSQVHDLAENAMQTLQKKLEKPERKPRQTQGRQAESEGYKKFKAEWRAMTKDQRLARAKEVGAKWNHSEDSVIDAMRMQMAVREKLGVEKYQ